MNNLGPIAFVIAWIALLTGLIVNPSQSERLDHLEEARDRDQATIADLRDAVNRVPETITIQPACTRHDQLVQNLGC